MTLSPEHKLLRMIGAEPKRTKKIKMLKHFRKSTKIKNVIAYSIDPFKKYFIKKFPDNNKAKGQGVSVIDSSTWTLLDKLASRELTGIDAKEILFAHLRDLTSTEAELLCRIILHDLQIGVAAGTANTVWPGLIIERFVQKAEDYESDQLVLPSYAGLKLDGIRFDYKTKVFTSRSGHTISGLDHIREYIQAKGGGYWDGELIVPALAHDFDAASGYIRSGKTYKPLARAVVFDNLTIAKLKQNVRLNTLPRVFEKYDWTKGEDNAPATYLKHHLFHDEETILTYFSYVLNQGHEGLVVKHPRARYRAGRTYNWMKLKKGDSKEFRVADFYEGEGELTGTLGGITVDVAGVAVDVGSGFSREQRDLYWSDPDKYLIGKKATINFMEYTKNGSLRHPIFKTIRWDI